jgi:hypothetical protein
MTGIPGGGYCHTIHADGPAYLETRIYKILCLWQKFFYLILLNIIVLVFESQKKQHNFQQQEDLFYGYLTRNGR